MKTSNHIKKIHAYKNGRSLCGFSGKTTINTNKVTCFLCKIQMIERGIKVDFMEDKIEILKSIKIKNTNNN